MVVSMLQHIVGKLTDIKVISDEVYQRLLHNSSNLQLLEKSGSAGDIHESPNNSNTKDENEKEKDQNRIKIKLPF